MTQPSVLRRLLGALGLAAEPPPPPPSKRIGSLSGEEVAGAVEGLFELVG